jgi:ketosteroid isomerase-like protein
MEDQQIRAALDQHWAASAAGDLEKEHEIYDDDVVVDYPQSKERIFSRHSIQALRGHLSQLDSRSGEYLGTETYGSPNM